MDNLTLNLQLQAYHEIAQRILTTEYKPGQRISEKELETNLGIGRTPVREALLQLRREGLVNAIPQSGTYVTKIDLDMATNARFIRESLEEKIVKEAAATLNMGTIQQLHDIIRNQENFAEQKNYNDFFNEDEAFHKTFYIATGHEQVWNWMQTVNLQFNRFRWLRLKVSELPWATQINEHKKILAAVEHHNPDEAERLSAGHLHLMLDEENQLIKAFPDYFINIDPHQLNQRP